MLQYYSLSGCEQLFESCSSFDCMVHAVQMLERLSAPDQPQHQSICFTYWLQWHLSKQLKSASEFARQHQIALKGDLPYR